MNYIFYTLLFLTALIACHSDKKKETVTLENELREKFSAVEITDLKELLLFFDNLTVSQTKTSTLDSAYTLYLDKLRYNDSRTDFEKKIMTNSFQVDSFMKGYKSKHIFEEIWKVEFGHKEKGFEDSYELIPNIHGKYIYVINKAINSNPIFTQYKETLRMSGAIPPSIIAGFQKYKDMLNFNNEVVRLVVAIHYISIISTQTQNL